MDCKNWSCWKDCIELVLKVVFVGVFCWGVCNAVCCMKSCNSACDKSGIVEEGKPCSAKK